MNSLGKARTIFLTLFLRAPTCDTLIWPVMGRYLSSAKLSKQEGYRGWACQGVASVSLLKCLRRPFNSAILASLGLWYDRILHSFANSEFQRGLGRDLNGLARRWVTAFARASL